MKRMMNVTLKYIAHDKICTFSITYWKFFVKIDSNITISIQQVFGSVKPRWPTTNYRYVMYLTMNL